jgi:hypothetical protein
MSIVNRVIDVGSDYLSDFWIQVGINEFISDYFLKKICSENLFAKKIDDLF